MFEDLDAKQGLAINRESSDRSLAYVIWSRNLIGQLPVEDAWSLLHERYPSEPRFLLLHAYEELLARSKAERRASAPSIWTPTLFLNKTVAVLDGAGGRLNPEVRDLIAIAQDELHPLAEPDSSRLDRIRSRVGARLGDAGAAAKRLARLSSDTIRELHEKTTGDKPIGGEKEGTEWKRLVDAAGGPARKYAADAKVAAGALVEHPKFGVGVVMSVEPNRANILFESGARKLVCG